MRMLKGLAKTGISFSQATSSNATNGISKTIIFLSSLFCLPSIKSRKILHHSWRTFFGQLKNSLWKKDGLERKMKVFEMGKKKPWA